NYLVKIGGGFKVNNKIEAFKILRTLLTDDNYRKESGQISGNYVLKNIGATDKIIAELKKYF
nr:3-deoxy-D-manno-octulosonic acid transferase [Melioribacteraceae bacterium]